MKSGRHESIYRLLSRDIDRAAQKGRKRKIELAQTIRQIRTEKGLSGVSVCRRAGGLDPRTLTAVEKGRIRNPSIGVLQSVAEGLGVSVSDLFRRAEGLRAGNFYAGSQKGAYQMDFRPWHIKAIAYTPLNRDFFCGKFILGARKALDKTFMEHPHSIFVSTLVGRFEVLIEGQEVTLREGDNIFFNGALRHVFYNPLRRESSLLIVTPLT